jgi:hypothetical protein
MKVMEDTPWSCLVAQYLAVDTCRPPATLAASLGQPMHAMKASFCALVSCLFALTTLQASALSIVQEITFTGVPGGGGSGSGNTISGYFWHIDPFSPSLGTLTSAVLEYSMTGTATAFLSGAGIPGPTDLTMSVDHRVSYLSGGPEVGSFTSLPEDPALWDTGSRFHSGNYSFTGSWAIPASQAGSDGPLFLRVHLFGGAHFGINTVTMSGTARLTYHYTAPNPVILSIRTSQVEICLTTESNRVYQVQSRTGLSSNEWNNLGGQITGDGATICITDSVPLGTPQRFYRTLVVR